MEQKRCTRCGIEKPIELFARKGEGRRAACKACVNASNREYAKRPEVRERKKQYERAYWRKYPEEHKAYLNNWRKKNIDKVRKYVAAEMKKDPIKFRARKQLLNAMKSGKIIKQPCERCGDLFAQGHHEDYSRPLDVVWLCSKHHRERHLEIENDSIS